MLKTILKICLAITSIAVLIVVGVLIYRYRGLIPILRPPSQDIVELIEKANQTPPKEADKNLKTDTKTPPGGAAPGANKTELPLTLPPGFSISVFATELGHPRDLILDPRGNLLVSTSKDGSVLALRDLDGDGDAEVSTVIANLNDPHGLAFRCAETCQLYIAETDQVAVYDYDQDTLTAGNKQKIIDLPGGGRHFTRSILFTSNDKLLISVGSSCDTCQEEDWRRAAILIANPDGTDLKSYASGLRNSVFMTRHPQTNQIWATEMGRDHLGDDLPPDEINILLPDEDYGWPTCYGQKIHDTVFDKNVYSQNPCEYTIASHIDLQAHSSPLGLDFFPAEGWSEDYRGDLLVAYHGSWNRSIPTGYKIMRFDLDEEGNEINRRDFISGWLTESEEVLGRPADVLINPDGTIYISDDKVGVIYKITNNQ